MLYINGIIYDLLRRKQVQNQFKILKKIIRNVIHEDNVDDDNETTASFLLTSRCRVESIEKNDLDKSSTIQKWLDDST
jgi:hypothetical protein